ncbi:hypothetical protein I3842_03G128600 [Carya illinoinensis]|uniref:Uncharacterized protein n=1 Tax=Carya illinoinensis TaxID=32201 RepID=A0A922FKA5_CARIL|nr:hypothetical protein I3842_03G128600 [Carya illinoinensis]
MQCLLCFHSENWIGAQYIGIDFQEPYVEAHLDVVNGSIKSYPSNGINFASAS